MLKLNFTMPKSTKYTWRHRSKTWLPAHFASKKWNWMVPRTIP